MSLSATRLYRDRFSPELSLKQELADRGLVWDGRNLEYLDERPWQIDASEIRALLDGADWAQITEGKSWGAKWIALRCIRSGLHGVKLEQAVEELRAMRRIHRAVGEDLKRFGNASAAKLVQLGIRTIAQADRFIWAYEKFGRMDRPWGSCYQVNQHRIHHMVNGEINYNKLPDWVLKVLLNVDRFKFGGDRPGNIWRLSPCAKAWKWCPDLPKRVAEKVGKMSVKARMLAPLCWYADSHPAADRADQVALFWELMSEALKFPLSRVLDWACSDRRGTPDSHRMAAMIAEYCNLPHGVIEVPRDYQREDLNGIVATYADPKTACQALFGCAGKATEKAFQLSDRNRWQWASAIGEGNPDAIQKILQMQPCIEFQSEAVAFLLSLPMVSRLRLLKATTFRYRGEECPVSADHVRDTGYLWQNIKNRPELGRVRGWFSVHETLAAEFVKELPDEALPVASNWQAVDGLCSVDRQWSIALPNRVATLKYYGQVLRNCIGGYGPAIKSGRSVILAVREHGAVTHAVEVCGNYVNQFYAYGNSYADYAIKDSVCESLRLAGLIS